MKNLKFTLPVLCLALAFSACDSVGFGDINDDDDAVLNPNTEGLLAGGMNRFFTLAGRDYHTKPLLYVQYMSQNVYTDEQLYNESPAGWNGYYIQTLSNFREVVEVASAEEVDPLTLTYGAPINQAGVAELMSVLVWKRLTDTYGPVPYTEALGEGESLTVPYTDQEAIYRDLIARAQAARDMLNPSLAGPTGDVVYGGDVEMWRQFANSLLLSMSMQLSNNYPESGGYAAQVFQEALGHSAGVIDEVGEEMWYEYANAPGAENPFALLRPADYDVSATFVDALNGQADETGTLGYSNETYDHRLNVLVDDPTLEGRPYGLNAYPADAGPFTMVNSAIWSPAAPLPFMTAAYTYLNRAEAAVRGWTSEDAEEMFTQGVMHSYATIDQHWDDGAISSGELDVDGSAFAEARWDDAEPLQVIGEEKWVALFPQGFEAWAEWRRTGYPELIPATDAVNDGSIPRRYLYPSEEAGVNAANYQAALQMLTPGQDSNTSRFWWDQ